MAKGAQRRTDLPGGKVATQREVAEAFGVAEGTITTWRNRGAPPPVDGVWDLVAVAKWREEQSRPASVEDESSKQRLERAKAEMAEIELAQRRGELISRAEVDNHNLQRIVSLRNALLALPRQLAPKLEGLDVRAMMGVIQSRVEQLLDDFADQDP
jgi:phage terminase Nu1 subunit (DNA packaging protein)